MIAFLIVVIILAALGILGAVVEGFLWLTAISAIVLIVAVIYGAKRLSTWVG